MNFPIDQGLQTPEPASSPSLQKNKPDGSIGVNAAESEADGPGPLLKALETALGATETTARDGAAIELARQYAELLDQCQGSDEDATTMAAIGPKLHALLNDLGMTPGARAKKGGQTGEQPGAGVVTQLDTLRARARARKHGA